MKTLKRVVTVLIAVTLVAACFSGCNKQQPDGSSSTTSSSSAAPTEAKKDTIVVWTYPVEKNYKDNFAAIKSDFEAQNKNITIQVEELTWAEGSQKFDTAINAGDPPDVMFTGPQAKYIQTGLELPIEDYIDKSLLSDYDQNALEYMKVDGKLYGLPLYVALHTIGGNKKLLDEAGIDYKKIQENGWTWDEFKTLAKKGTKKKADGRQQYGFIFATTGSTTLELLDHMLINNGLVHAIDENGNYAYTDPKFLETLKFIRSLIDEGIMPKEANQITPAKRMEMLYNETAMLVGKAIPYYEEMIKDNNKKVKDGTAPKDQKEIDFVLLPEPHNAGQKAVTCGSSDGYTLYKQKNYKGDEHTKTAAKVLTALTSGKAGISAVVLCLPQVTKSGASMYNSKYTMSAENKTASDMLYKNIMSPSNAKPELAKKASQIRDEVLMAKYPALLGKEVTPEQMAKAVSDKAKELFGK